MIRYGIEVLDLAVEIQLFHDSGFEKVYRGRLVVAVEQDVVDGFVGLAGKSSFGRALDRKFAREDGKGRAAARPSVGVVEVAGFR